MATVIKYNMLHLELLAQWERNKKAGMSFNENQAQAHKFLHDNCVTGVWTAMYQDEERIEFSNYMRISRYVDVRELTSKKSNQAYCAVRIPSMASVGRTKEENRLLVSSFSSVVNGCYPESAMASKRSIWLTH